MAAVTVRIRKPFEPLFQSNTRDHLWLLGFRWLLVMCQGITICVTWALWQTHTLPPMLPALPLPAFDMGILLLLSLGLILVKPVYGLTLHTLLLIYAMLIDQTRMQPEIISLMLLMWGTLPNPNARAVARAHLIALWVWAGVNKLLSPAFLVSAGPSMLVSLIPFAPTWLRANGGYLIALTELFTGLLAIFPRTRRLSGLFAFGLHIGIFLSLSPFGRNWNQSVWAWNIALALAGFALIVPWRESPVQTIRQSRLLVRALIIVLLLSPAGWFVGITDAYLAHHLYSSDVPRASTTARTGSTWQAFNVPLPPEHRLFEQSFRLTCQAGDKLIIRDTRWWYVQQGLGAQSLLCPEPGS